jgi:hypothetical protein
MTPSGMLRRVALLRTDFSEERSSSIIRVTRIGELGATLAVTSKHPRRRHSLGNTLHFSVINILENSIAFVSSDTD